MRTARLLACECDAAARPAVGDLLRTLGYEVTAHHTLEDTLREATTSDFDVIVASVPTADEASAKLLGLLRRARSGTPLVIVTSDGSLAMRRTCLGASPYFYAVRPVDADELRDVIAGALTRGR